MREIYVINPAAGIGGAREYENRENVYVTAGAGDCTRFIKETLKNASEDINFIVCGGDGTVAEAAQGLLEAGNAHGVLSVRGAGTGNDFLKAVEAVPENEFRADVMTVNGRAAVNAVNMGFDLEVVDKANGFKKHRLMSGHTAYVLGVVSALFGRYGAKMKVEYVDGNGERGCVDGELLLTVAGGGQYYGGGFMASPAADIRDGLIDLMVVKKVSRLKFISLVGKYKSGRHIDAAAGKPVKQFEKIMIYKRCKSVTVSGIRQVCYDGEIVPANEARIEIIPSAIRIKK